MKSIFIILIVLTGIITRSFAQETATIQISADKPQTTISPLIYGQFIEFLGTCINGGIYEAESPLSDGNGFRKDVLEKVKQLNPPLLRYPAGTYIKIFNWKDGIGPKGNRPRTRNLIWGGVEDNHFGTAEFVTYCRMIGAEPNLVINMSTATAMEAAQWVEYCNGTTDSYWANLRRSHGYPEPFNVKYWALGNEEAAIDDCGKHQNPEKYVDDAWQFVKLMKLTDPTIKLVLCGADMEWNKIILDKMHPVCDYLSVHFYARNDGSNQYGALLKNIKGIEKNIHCYDSLVASYPDEVINFGKWYRFPPRTNPVKLAVDEWGIWLAEGSGQYNLTIEYQWEHALATAQYLNIFHRHSKTIGLATWAQMVNVLGAIMTDSAGSVFQTVAYPMQYYRKYAGEKNVPCSVVSQALENGVPTLDISATTSADGKTLTLFAINFHPEKQIEANVTFEGASYNKIINYIELNAPSVNSKNTLAEKNKNVVSVREISAIQSDKLTLSPHSVTIIQFGK